MSLNLYQASEQWATRPEDQRFRTLQEMHDKTKSYADSAIEKDFPWQDLRVEASGSELALVGKAGVPALLTHHALGQMAQRVEAPASYLRKLPATLAAQNLNHGLKARQDGNARLLFHSNGGLVLRAATTDNYVRVWDYEVIQRLMDLCDRCKLTPAHQTFNWNGQAMTEEQTANADRALYASDHDMFAFLMSTDRDVQDPVGQKLFRGVIVTNSEVGDRSLGIMGFWFREVCGNHIIWNASNLATLRMTHVGEIRDRWNAAQFKVRRYFDGATSFETAKFEETTRQIAGTKDEVLDLLFGKKALGLSRKALESSYAAVKPLEDGDPKTVWGFAQGITRHAQTVPYADERTNLDRAAGRLLDFKF